MKNTDVCKFLCRNEELHFLQNKNKKKHETNSNHNINYLFNAASRSLLLKT